jgi:hypothetical protein
MAAICTTCSRSTIHYKQKLAPEGAASKWIITCHACANPRHSELTANPLGDLTLTHVTDEAGQPVRVTSLRQLREAEKRYHFSSVVANSDAANFDTPPAHTSGDVLSEMSRENKWLYPEVAEQMLADMRRSGEL